MRQVFNVPGRCFPVDVIHSREDHQRDYINAAVDTVLQVHMDQPPGGCTWQLVQMHWVTCGFIPDRKRLSMSSSKQETLMAVARLHSSTVRGNQNLC